MLPAKDIKISFARLARPAASELGEVPGELDGDLAPVIHADAQVLDNLPVHAHEEVGPFGGAQPLHVARSVLGRDSV